MRDRTIYNQIAQLEYELIHDQMAESTFYKKLTHMHLITRMYTSHPLVPVTAPDMTDIVNNSVTPRVGANQS